MINIIPQRPQSRAYQKKIELSGPIIRKTDQQQSQRCFNMAKQHQKRNQIEKAQSLYLQATIHNPKLYKAYCNLGACLRMKGLYQQAIGAYIKAKNIKNDDAITNYNLANTYRIIGSEQKAINLYQFVIGLKQKNSLEIGQIYIDSYINLGVCYKNIEDYNNAISCFQKIKKIYPQNKDIIFNEAVCYLKLFKSLHKKKNNQNNQLLLQQTFKEASNLLTQVLKNEANNQVALLGQIQVKCIKDKSKQNLKECIQQLKPLISKTNSSKFMKEQGTIHKQYCQNLLKQIQQQENKEILKQQQIIRKQQQQENRSKKIEEQLKKSSQAKQNKIRQDKEKIEKEKASVQTKVGPTKSQKQIQKSKIESKQSIKNEIINDTKSINSNSNILLKTEQQKEVQQVCMAKKKFQSALQKLMQQVETLNNSNQEELLQKSISLIQSLSKSTIKQISQGLVERIRNQLLIILYSVLGQKCQSQNYYRQAYETYLSCFLSNDINTPVTQSMLYIQTHRAIASVLTTLKSSSKAIQHYQIISNWLNTSTKYDPNQLEQLYSGLAVNYQSQGLHTKAIDQFNKAIQLNPSNYVLYYNLGYCQQSAGLYQKAIEHYKAFLQNVQKQNTLDPYTKNSYFIQSLVSIFMCLNGSLDSKIKEFQESSLIFDNIFSDSNFKRLYEEQQNNMMRFYLKGCDIYQQIYQLQLSNKNSQQNAQNLKLIKEKLLKVYFILLKIPLCPDRDQIILSCGNLLYEENQYLTALSFYQKVNEDKNRVLNNISLALFNLNEYQKAFDYMEYAAEVNSENKIIQFNFATMKWAFGLNQSQQSKALFDKYPCQCESQFGYRVQFVKELLNIFSIYLQKSCKNQQDLKKIQAMNVKQLLNNVLNNFQGDKSQSNKRRKFLFLKKYIQQHSKQFHKQIVKQIEISEIAKILDTCCKKALQKQELNKQLEQLLKLLKPHQNAKNYISTMNNTLLLFIFNHTLSQENLISQVLLEHIQKSTSYEINFKDKISQGSNYPQRIFSVVYPSIEMKVENFVQSLKSWQINMQSELGYLFRIIESIAYKHSLKNPLIFQYYFPHCKGLKQCKMCFEKLNKFCKSILKLQQEQLAKYKNLRYENKEVGIRDKFLQQFALNLEKKLKKDEQNNMYLQMELNNEGLPLQIRLSFIDLKGCQQFIRQICKQVQVNEIKILEDKSGWCEVIVNKRVRIVCEWKERSKETSLFERVLNCVFDLRTTALMILDDDLIASWRAEDKLKSLMGELVGK